MISRVVDVQSVSATMRTMSKSELRLGFLTEYDVDTSTCDLVATCVCVADAMRSPSQRECVHKPSGKFCAS